MTHPDDARSNLLRQRELGIGLLCDERAQSVVESIAQLAKKLGYRVVAEGVETAQMQDLLQHLGCDEIQGFHLARPMRPEALGDWLKLRGGAG